MEPGWRAEQARSTRLASYVGLLGYRKRIIDLNTKVTNRALASCLLARIVQRRPAVGELLTGGEPSLNHAHHRANVLKRSRMGLALQARHIEHHDAIALEVAAIGFLIGIDIAEALLAAPDRPGQPERDVVLGDE